MKKAFLIFVMALFSQFVIAQSRDKSVYAKFESSLGASLTYPTDMISNCKSTTCILKIELDLNRHVSNVNLSDSADSLLKEEFLKNKIKIDFISFEQYVKENFGNDGCNTFLIPVTFSISYKESCPPSTISISSLAKYYQFNAKSLFGNVVILPAFSQNLSIHN